MAKKILMVAYTNYVTDARPRREAETLVSRGDTVLFIGLAERGAPRTETINGVTLNRVSFSRYRGDSGIRYILHYLRFFFVASILAARLHLKHRFDVLYVHTMPDFMVFVSIIPKMLGAKVILNIHDMMPELYMSKFNIGEGHILIRMLKLQERISCWFSDRIICVHHPHQQILVSRNIPAEKITILMNVPDPLIFAVTIPVRDIPTKRNTMIYHGTVAQRLGLDIAVDAFCEVLKHVPDARFEIYGDGDAAEHLEMKIRILNIEQNVIFNRKFFKVEDIPGIVAGSTLGIIPNRRDLATEYMLPVKLMEYVYLDIPVVAPSLLTIQYYFTSDMVEYFEPGDVRDLAGKIVNMFSDSEKRVTIARNARSFTTKYSWNTMKNDLFALIDAK